MKDRETKLRHIYNNFGLEVQKTKLLEEVREFIEAIEDYENYDGTCKVTKQGKKEHIIEEIADVMVLLNQFSYKYELDGSDVSAYIDFKIDRTLDRIKSGFYL